MLHSLNLNWPMEFVPCSIYDGMHGGGKKENKAHTKTVPEFALKKVLYTYQHDLDCGVAIQGIQKQDEFCTKSDQDKPS